MKYLNQIKNIIVRAISKTVYFIACRDSKFFSLLFNIASSVTKSTRTLKELTVEWLDEKKEEVIMTLASEETGNSYSPKDIGGAQRVAHVQLPAVNLYHFENARISVLSSSILLDNKIIIERVAGLEVKRCDYSAGHVRKHSQKSQKSALVRILQTEQLEQGIFFGGNGSFNYYHWMIEILPKMKYLNELDKLGYEGYPLLVSEDVDHIKSFREALNYIVKDRPIVMLNKDKAYFVGKLLYINAPNNLPFNLRRNEKMRTSDYLTRVSSINFLRNRLCPNLDVSTYKNEGGRIFFARRGKKRSYNEQEIYEIFRENGFQKVFIEELSLKEQISLISSAEMIAGPSGASWTNIIFCREGTKCLCWMADGYGDFSTFSNLAMVVGADMRYVTFKTDAKSTRELYTKNYYLEAKKIRKTLDTLLSVDVQKYTGSKT